MAYFKKFWSKLAVFEGSAFGDAKTKKEHSMASKARDKMEKELAYLRDGLSIKGRLKNYDKVLERIGTSQTVQPGIQRL